MGVSGIQAMWRRGKRQMRADGSWSQATAGGYASANANVGSQRMGKLTEFAT